MLSKTLSVLLVVYFLSDFSYGQKDKKFFREDYTYLESIEGFYKFHTTSRTWAEGLRVCAREGASLFYPETSEEATAVLSFWKKTKPNIQWAFGGMSDLTVERVFETIDGKLVSELYSNWRSGQPDNVGGIENCGCLNFDEMHDCNCNQQLPFICKKSLQSLQWNYNCSMSNLDGQKDKMYFRKDYTYLESIEGFYKFHTTSRTWAEGLRVCAREGASLFYPETSEEATAVLSFWKKTKPNVQWAFGGMSDLTAGRVFETIDGKLVSELYSNWRSGQPDNVGGIENCGCLNFDEMHDCNCNQQLPFICKKSLQSLQWNYNCSMSNLDGQKDKRFFREDYTYLESIEGFYKFHTTSRTWAEGLRVCAVEGASLFYPETSEEATAVLSFWKKTKPNIQWVFGGMSDLMVEGIFETNDGKLVSELYTNWRPGQPDNIGGKEKCGCFNLGEMHDCNCNQLLPFICKKSLQSLKWNHNCNMSNLDYISNGLSKCYKLHTTPLNWIEAYAVCRQEQSYLAVVSNPLEADYLANLTVYASNQRVVGNYLSGIYHVGFHNRLNAGWQTVKGTPINVDTNVWWDNHLPIIGEYAKCGSMFFNGRLNTINCDTKSFFICEHEAASSYLNEEDLE